MLRINSTRTHEERGADPNQTPPAVVRALAHHEHLPQWILDPAVGLGHVLDTFRALGHNVIGRDVVDYGWAARLSLTISRRCRQLRTIWA